MRSSMAYNEVDQFELTDAEVEEMEGWLGDARKYARAVDFLYIKLDKDTQKIDKHLVSRKAQPIREALAYVHQSVEHASINLPPLPRDLWHKIKVSLSTAQLPHDISEAPTTTEEWLTGRRANNFTKNFDPTEETKTQYALARYLNTHNDYDPHTYIPLTHFTLSNYGTGHASNPNLQQFVTDLINKTINDALANNQSLRAATMLLQKTTQQHLKALEGNNEYQDVKTPLTWRAPTYDATPPTPPQNLDALEKELVKHERLVNIAKRVAGMPAEPYWEFYIARDEYILLLEQAIERLGLLPRRYANLPSDQPVGREFAGQEWFTKENKAYTALEQWDTVRTFLGQMHGTPQQFVKKHCDAIRGGKQQQLGADQYALISEEIQRRTLQRQRDMLRKLSENTMWV